jgi:hypothetical protein
MFCIKYRIGCRPVGALTTFAPLKPTAMPRANDNAPLGLKAIQ